MLDVNSFEAMEINLASPEKIRSWSYGEVKEPETINYRTLKAEKDGLFCERIFGPEKDWECSCGKYKRIRYKGRVCERCGVEVTRSNVRRERMGHIELAAPVTHIWYFKGIPSRIGLVLDLSPRLLEEVIYFASYIVIDPGETSLEYKQLLSEEEYRQIYREYGDTFVAKMGAEAIQDLLKQVDVEAEVEELRSELKTATGQRRTRAVRRLEIMQAFYNSGNKPEWMVMTALPVIPPELRPMVQLEGGRFATSDLNDLYRRVINRNNRLKRLLDMGAPNIIVQNEKRMLQEAVDSLIDNGRRGRAVTGPGNRPLKSLSHLLKGKQGRFRQNLLGKRVDYSGRSVIVVGPELKMYQCGIPMEMAIELYKPFLMRELVERQVAGNIKSARRMIDRQDEEIWPVIEDIIKEHPVLLNRAPTLHRLGIQAFEPVLVEGRAIKLHPLVCEAYNADFDGDQMAVHLPLSEEAQAEARLLMLAAHHILNPKDGNPVVTPSQDMVLGNYYLTFEKAGQIGEGFLASDPTEVMLAYENGYLTLHSKIAVSARSLADQGKPMTDWQKERFLVTTPGKLIFNEIMPVEFPYLNEPTEENLIEKTPDKYFIETTADPVEEISKMDLAKPFKKSTLSSIIAEVYKRFGVTETSKMLDKMKDLGFKYSTKSGITVAVSDIVELETKPALIEEAHQKVDNITKQYRRGLITDQERYSSVIRTWDRTRDEIEKQLQAALEPENSIAMMAQSGARGNISNITQLAGMRGNMASPSGEIIELPVTSNFREGLSVLEMFISTHGARKGMTDTALKTADSGYLTRRLVDVAQDVIVREEECGTDQGTMVEAIRDGNSIIEPLEERITGRYAFRTIYHPETGEVLCQRNKMIDQETAELIVNSGIEQVYIRSVFNCRTNHGVCKKCYGSDLATGKEVEVGEAVGTIAAQSIGEPGTQLTMRTFHTGGVADGADITQGLPRIQEIFEARNPKGQATISEVDGVVVSIEDKPSENTKEITVEGGTDTRTYSLIAQANLLVSVGDMVRRGDPLNEGSIDPKELLEVTDVKTVQTYLLNEVQNVYRSQGVDIGDKHVEVMIRQMLRKVEIMDPGSTDILPGALMDISAYEEANRSAIMTGEVPATARPVLLGITKAALETESFISAASFQETTRVLTDAAIRGDRDELIGLKENVIIGKLIPAGTGLKRYRSIEPNIKPPVKEEEGQVPEEAQIDEKEAVEEPQQMK